VKTGSPSKTQMIIKTKILVLLSIERNVCQD